MTHFRRQAGLAAALLLVFASSARADVVIPDDQDVQGSLCAGLTCVDGEVFGPTDTVKLKTDDPGVLFDDLSAGGVDWSLRANDGTPTNAFFLRDITGSTTPFSVFAGAPTDALKVAGNGNIGLGTDAPGLDLSIRTTDTPAIRMEQTNGAGYTAQTWDIGANEANFFVRDLTGGSRLPFRIRPGAPTSSLDIAANSNVGFGTASPAFPLDAVRTGVTGPMQRLANNGPSSLRFDNTTVGGSKWDIGGGATDTFIVGTRRRRSRADRHPRRRRHRGRRRPAEHRHRERRRRRRRGPAGQAARPAGDEVRAGERPGQRAAPQPGRRRLPRRVRPRLERWRDRAVRHGRRRAGRCPGIGRAGRRSRRLARRLARDAHRRAREGDRRELGSERAGLVSVGTAVDARVAKLERSNRTMAKRLATLEKKLKKLAKKH